MGFLYVRNADSPFTQFTALRCALQFAQDRIATHPPENRKKKGRLRAPGKDMPREIARMIFSPTAPRSPEPATPV